MRYLQRYFVNIYEHYFLGLPTSSNTQPLMLNIPDEESSGWLWNGPFDIIAVFHSEWKWFSIRNGKLQTAFVGYLRIRMERSHMAVAVQHRSPLVPILSWYDVQPHANACSLHNAHCRDTVDSMLILVLCLNAFEAMPMMWACYACAVLIHLFPFAFGQCSITIRRQIRQFVIERNTSINSTTDCPISKTDWTVIVNWTLCTTFGISKSFGQ